MSSAGKKPGIISAAFSNPAPPSASPPPQPATLPWKSRFRTGNGYVVKALSLTALAGIGGLPQIVVPESTADNLPMGFSFIGAPQFRIDS